MTQSDNISNTCNGYIACAVLRDLLLIHIFEILIAIHLLIL